MGNTLQGLQLGLVVTRDGTEVSPPLSARQAVYQSTHPPFNKSVCPPQQGMHITDASVRGEKRGTVWLLLDEFGPEPHAQGTGKQARQRGRL